MAKQVVKIKTVGKYNGHSFRPNGAVDLKLKFSYEELVNYYMKLPLLRSENTKIVAKIEDQDPIDLGTYMLKNYTMDHDGEGTITFNSLYDYVEADSLNSLVEHKDKLIRLAFKASIEAEDEDTEEE